MPEAHGRFVAGVTSSHTRGEDRGDGADEAARYARSLLETSVNPLVSTNPQGKITDVNAATERATGIPRDQLIGTDFADCFKEPEEARAAFKRVLVEGLLSEYPLALRHVSGTLTDVEYHATVYRDESGELQAVFAAARDTTEAQEARRQVARRQVARLALIAASSHDATPIRDAAGDITSLSITDHDISERVRAERELRESEEKFSAAFHASPDHMAITKLSDGTLLEVNEGFTQLLGYSRAEIIGTTTLELAIWADPAGRAAFVASLEESGQTSELEVSLRRGDGGLITCIAAARVVELQGEMCALSVVHDISERKQAEEALRRSEAHLRTLIDTLPDLVWLKDPDGVYLSCNRRFERFFGAEERDIVGKTDYDFTDAEQADSFRQHDVAAMAAAAPTANEEEIVFVDDGHREVLETIKTPVRASDDRLIGVLGVGCDITERKQAKEEVRRHAEQLQRTVEGAVLAMSHMVESRDPYTAGHERRTAELATAIGAEMGLEGGALEALRLAAMIHDIGKIGVPAEILSKPGRLSEVEFSLIKQHPKSGFDILADVDFGCPVAEIILQHHERLDGSGYPQALSGADILTEARILAVADVVEAMSSHRPYRAALGMEAALAEVREHAGVKYDAVVVATCVRLVEEQGFQFTP